MRLAVVFISRDRWVWLLPRAWCLPLRPQIVVWYGHHLMRHDGGEMDVVFEMFDVGS